jgi:Protein of unknown function (DUF3592)
MTTFVLTLLGFLIVAGALVGLVWRIRWLRGTLRTRAEVLHIGSHREESGGQYNFMETVYVSRLRFTGTDGSTTHSFEQQHGTSEPGFGVGDHVTIRYHRADPSESAEVPFIVHEIMIWFAMLVCAALGSAFLFAGLQMARA